jgi:hypothetical protein
MQLASSHDKTLLALAEQPPVRVRGEWKHYRCPYCSDKSAHLGIHATTGRVRCLRCGFAAWLDTKIKHVGVRVGHAPVYHDCFDTTILYPRKDEPVREYMRSRKITTQSTGWFYGRKQLLGCAVFPSFDERGHVWYMQAKPIVPAVGRYFSMPNAIPNLDHWPMLNKYDTSSLVLVEGPIDALWIRQCLHLWASPLYGTTPAHQLLECVCRASRKYGVKRVFVMFDRESHATRSARRIARKLRMYGLKADAVVPDKMDERDPAEMSSGELVEAILLHGEDWYKKENKE